jgi:Virulence protein RhuM family
MSDEPLPNSEIILYQTEDGRTRIQCRFENETIWLTQALIAELFQVTVPTVNEHLKGIYAEGELAAGATIRKFRIVRSEGKREVTREIEHYHLDTILAVGFRVRSHRGTQFRQWAMARSSEYLVKGFTMDDERLKNPPGKGQRPMPSSNCATTSHFFRPSKRSWPRLQADNARPKNSTPPSVNWCPLPSWPMKVSSMSSPLRD